MKALRTSMFPPDRIGHAPMTTIVRESDLTIPIDEMVERLQDRAAGSLNVFLVNDIFEMANDATELQTSIAGTERMNERATKETNMAMLYYYDADKLPIVSQGGILMSDAHGPDLSVDDIEYVLDLLALHANYDQQTIIATTADGEQVTRRPDGEFFVEVVR